MVKEEMLARYLEPLLRGDRKGCRAVIEEAMQSGIPANSVYVHIIWPVMVEIENLLRKDKITAIEEHLATRVNRTIVDQLQNKLPRRPGKSKKVVVCCAPDELQELGAQMMTDLFESDGWDVRFLGGGLTNDDILSFSVNAWPDMRILVSGGLFNRAEGLWQEMEADLYAENAIEALEVASSDAPVSHGEQRTINRRKKRRQVVQEPEQMAVSA